MCPTGIDIREGLQYECIGCAACVDGCNQVMDKMGYPRGLIRYSTENALERGWSGAAILRRVARPRVLVYSAVLLAVVCVLFALLWARTPLKVDVLRDRGTLTRQTPDGWIENVYRLQIMNAVESARRYRVSGSGLPGAVLVARQPVEVPPATTIAVPVTLRADPATTASGAHAVIFVIEDLDDPRVAVSEKSRFNVK